MEEGGKPSLCVSLGLSSWSHIISATTDSRSFPLLSRMSEYYEDAHFDPGEIPQLAAELDQLRKEMIAAEKTVNDMLALCRQAEVKRASIMAIAD